MSASGVPCACGCGALLAPVDDRGRPRRFVSGHNARRYAVGQSRPCTKCGQSTVAAAMVGSWCRPCHRAYHNGRYPLIAERRRAQAVAWNHANAEYKRAYNRELRLRDPEAARARATAWRLANRDKRRLAEHAREARKWGANGRFTTEQWQLLCARYGHRCLACGAGAPLQADHVVPLCLGGTNTIDNIQPLCGPCNWRKHTATTDYRPLRQPLEDH